MGMHEARGTLAKAIKELNRRWIETRSEWADAQMEQFENTYMRNLESDLKTATTAMEQMTSLLHQVRRDCE